MTTNDPLQRLRECRPTYPADSGRLDAIRQRVSEEARAGDPPARSPRLSTRRIVLSASVAGVTVLAAVAVLYSPALRTPSIVPQVPSAYAAVQSAAAKTADAGSSGTMVTTLRATGRFDLAVGSTLAWHGDDFHLRATKEGFDKAAGTLFVEGRYYEGDGRRWVHHPEVEDPKDPTHPGSWIPAARADMAATRVQRVVGVLEDLHGSESSDGTTVYIGHATARAIAGEYRDTEGLPMACRPFPKLGEPDTSVKVMIVLGPDGLLRSWACSYSWDGADWVYTAEYRDLGTTPAIDAPDPSSIIEGDGTRG